MKRIVIIEAESIVRKHLSNLLKTEGYEVLGMFSASHEAINLMKFEKPDLVISSTRTKDRFDTIEMMLGSDLGRDVPVLFITGVIDSSIINRYQLTKPVAILSKPIDEYLLKKTLNDLLQPVVSFNLFTNCFR